MPVQPKITPRLVSGILPCIHLRVSLRRIASAANITVPPLQRAIERGRQPGAPEHLVRLAEAYDAVGHTDEYWDHQQGCALDALSRIAEDAR